MGPTQPPIKCVPGALFLWLERPWREANHTPSSAAVKEYVELYLHSPIRLHGVVLGKEKGQDTFTLQSLQLLR